MSRRMLIISVALLLLLRPHLDAAGSGVAEQALTPSEGVLADLFGMSVAVSRKTLVVGQAYDNSAGNGAPYPKPGAALIYEPKDGRWVETAKLTASDGRDGEQFGFSVAISTNGRRIVVGAPQAESYPPARRGAAYVFERKRGKWVEVARFTAERLYSQFGRTVSISRNTVVVGAEEDRAPGRSTGAVYVFTRDRRKWSKQARLSARDARPGDVLGGSVAISGDTIVAGARLVNNRAGAVYVFQRTGNRWVENAKLTSETLGQTRYFGLSVAITRDARTLAIGAPGGAGRVYMFKSLGGEWIETAALDASRWGCWWFGSSVAISGKRLVVGAPDWDASDDLMSQTGKVFLFSRAGKKWEKQREFQPGDLDDGDFFGLSVAISNSTVVAGAPHAYTSQHGLDRGAAYVLQ